MDRPMTLCLLRSVKIQLRATCGNDCLLACLQLQSNRGKENVGKLKRYIQMLNFSDLGNVSQK